MFKDGAVIKRVLLYTEESNDCRLKTRNKGYYSRPEKNAVLANQHFRIITDSDRQQLMNWIDTLQQIETTDTSELPVTFPEQPE